MEKSAEEVDKGLDQVYRLKARYAEREGKVQDIIVNLLTRRMKEDILKLSFENPINYKGKRVIIMRELPRDVIMQRKKLKKLVDSLRKKDVKFRWELPIGLSFMFHGRHTVIGSEKQMFDFIKDNGKFLETDI